MCVSGPVMYNTAEFPDNPEMWTATPWVADKVPWQSVQNDTQL